MIPRWVENVLPRAPSLPYRSTNPHQQTHRVSRMFSRIFSKSCRTPCVGMWGGRMAGGWGAEAVQDRSPIAGQKPYWTVCTGLLYFKQKGGRNVQPRDGQSVTECPPPPIARGQNLKGAKWTNYCTVLYCTVCTVLYCNHATPEAKPWNGPTIYCSAVYGASCPPLIHHSTIPGVCGRV